MPIWIDEIDVEVTNDPLDPLAESPPSEHAVVTTVEADVLETLAMIRQRQARLVVD